MTKLGVLIAIIGRLQDQITRLKVENVAATLLVCAGLGLEQRAPVLEVREVAIDCFGFNLARRDTAAAHFAGAIVLARSMAARLPAEIA